MQHVTQRERSREAVGVFDNMSALQEAVADLQIRTFPRENISVMGNPQDMIETFGTPVIAPRRIENHPDTPRQAPVRPEEKALGASAMIGGIAYVCATAAAIAAGATVTHAGVLPAAVIGGIVGALGGLVVVRMLDIRFKRMIERQIRRGGLLLWVRTPDAAHEKTACGILKAHGARHVRVHDIAYRH